LNYTVKQHPDHHRLWHITIHAEASIEFVHKADDFSEQRLTYVPYLRLVAANLLDRVVGDGFAEKINTIIRDRDTGGFSISVECEFETMDQRVAFGTAVSHLIGIPNFDDMPGNYYECFELRHTDTSDSYLRQAYRAFTLHTDGTYVKERTDWLLMMKMEERNAVGGGSRLLHLDDWEDLERFANHPLASVPFVYRSPSSKNYPVKVEKPTFYEYHGKPAICFIDQFVYPETLEQGRYFNDLCDSMETSAATTSLLLPPNRLMVINNHFWVHGREAFKKNPDLYRLLMRQRGYFREEA